ncbi:MAG TPA: hypothetical protein VEH04_01135, partial [Verrucomicrobiae bacterium]|nr:hypothetical protein [Verrucomicrobiae bacterium]
GASVEEKIHLVHNSEISRRESCSHRLRRADPKASSPILNNFRNSYKGALIRSTAWRHFQV